MTVVATDQSVDLFPLSVHDRAAATHSTIVVRRFGGIRLTGAAGEVTRRLTRPMRSPLSERSTRDWVLYCEAAFVGFNAIVTLDFTQAEQAEEMVCLGHIRDFHVIR